MGSHLEAPQSRLRAYAERHEFKAASSIDEGNTPEEIPKTPSPNRQIPTVTITGTLIGGAELFGRFDLSPNIYCRTMFGRARYGKETEL